MIKSSEKDFLRKASRILATEREEEKEIQDLPGTQEQSPGSGTNSGQGTTPGSGNGKDKVVEPKPEDVLSPEEFERLSKSYEENLGEFIKFIFNGILARQLGSVWKLIPEEEKTITYYSRKLIEQVLPVMYAKYTPLLGLLATIGAYAGTRIATVQAEKKKTKPPEKIETKTDESKKPDQPGSREEGERKDPLN